MQKKIKKMPKLRIFRGAVGRGARGVPGDMQAGQRRYGGLGASAALPVPPRGPGDHPAPDARIGAAQHGLRHAAAQPADGRDGTATSTSFWVFFGKHHPTRTRYQWQSHGISCVPRTQRKANACAEYCPWERVPPRKRPRLIMSSTVSTLFGTVVIAIVLHCVLRTAY